MNLIEQVEQIAAGKFFNEDEELIEVRLKPGLIDIQLESLSTRYPNKIPDELKELLQFSAGIDLNYNFPGSVEFNRVNNFGYEQIFENCLFFSHDGLGGCWAQEIKSSGEQGAVFLIGHDPGVLIKQADNLSEFLEQIYEYLLKNKDSFFSKVYNEISWRISVENDLLDFSHVSNSKDRILQEFVSKFDKDWLFADLRNVENGKGFPLISHEIVKHKDHSIWALKPYKSFWKRMKEKFNFSKEKS